MTVREVVAVEPCAEQRCQVTAQSYRNPGRVDEGGVLVVGASATGLQPAQEIRASGRPVTLAVGEHVRMPRVYRGRDVQWWMLACGVLDQRIEASDDPARAARAFAAAGRHAGARDARP